MRRNLALVFLLLASPALAQDLATPPEFKNLKYRSIGPAAGGRVNRVAGIAGDPHTYYAATASGGIWKSNDGGLNWRPVFDDQPDSSVGSIAVVPSNPNVVYAGAGEANIRGNVVEGHGIYKSTDAGKTWQHVWKQRGQIGTIIVHPTNADVAFAAVLGHVFGPNSERGVYRTTDGGKTWQKVLYMGDDAGASDVCFDLNNPQILFAGLWQARRKPWEMISGGPASGLYISRDGGDTWKQLGGAHVAPEQLKGLPPGIYGKIGVAVAPSDSRRVYALIEADKGGLFRSDDGGDTWRLVNATRTLRQRAFYYSTITPDPKNPDVVYCPNVPLLKSVDGGRTFQPMRGPHHGDHHDLWIDPTNPKRMINANDGGVDVTTNGGESWFAPPLPISQFYHIACDNRMPYHVHGAMQDLGTASGPSNSLAFGGIAPSDWISVGGGEAGHTASDPTNPNIVYAGEYGGYISRYDHRTRQARPISIYPITTVGKGGEELRYRFQWTSPIVVSPHDPKTVYHAGNVLFRTIDGGNSWAPASGDLTRNDKQKQKWSGGPITGDNTGVEVYCTIFALAEAPKERGVLWAGSDDGLVHVSRDNGKTWTNVTTNIPGMPEWGTVKCIEPGAAGGGTAYLVVDARRLDDPQPYLWGTDNYGQTWKRLMLKLPQDVPLHAVRQDPKQPGLLYVGTERGVIFSSDNGESWSRLGLNLPTVPVHDLVVKENDLVVGTHGRSIWVFDDLSPVRAFAKNGKAFATEELHLFAAQPATRWRYHRGNFARGAAENPPRGAVIYYYLKQKPKGELKLEIKDEQGRLVNTLTSRADADAPDEQMARFAAPRTRLTTEPGINRVAWDLSYAGPTTIRGAVGWPGAPTSGPTVNPGTYQLTLSVDGHTQTGSVEIKPDPRAQAPASDLEAQLKLALAVRDQITHVSAMVGQLRSIRQQLTVRNEALRGNGRAESIVRQGKELLAKLDEVEGGLHNPKAEIPYDLLAHKGGARVYSQLAALFRFLTAADGAPTQGMREVFEEQLGEVKRLETELARLIREDLAKLNDETRRLELPGVVVPAEKAEPRPAGRP